MKLTASKAQLRIFRLSIFHVIIVCLGINSLAQPYDPLSLHFKKDYQVRNFYNSSVTLDNRDFLNDMSDELKYPRKHLTSPGCEFKQNGGVLKIFNNSGTDQHSYFNLGKLHNYAAIDMDIQEQSNTSGTASALLSLYRDEDNRFVIDQRDIDAGNKHITLEIFKNGSSVFNHILSEEGITTPNTLRVHLTAKFINVLIIKNEEWTVLGSFDVAEYFELRDKSMLETFSLMAGARLGSGESIFLSKVEQYLTTGTAQADPKVLHYEDGSPIIEGNKIWVAMTTRAYGTQLYQGIYSYDLETRVWVISGTLAFNKGDGLLRQWSASDVFFDRNDKKWKVFTVSHRDDHKLYYGAITEDLRFGFHEIPSTIVDYPSVGNEEDPSVIYDSEAGKWRMAMCKNMGGGYSTLLMEADEWNGSWKEIAIYTEKSSTGILIQKIGGKRYVFLGRGDTPCSLEVLTYPGMEKIGELNLSEHPIGKNIWPAIIPVTRDSGTAYYLLTFDRDSWTGPRTYGNIHWYYAEEFAVDFYEYPE